jgi:hypothetical protein
MTLGGVPPDVPQNPSVRLFSQVFAHDHILDLVQKTN